MNGGAVQTEAVTISDTLMIVRITLAMHTRASPLYNAHEALVPPCEGLLRAAAFTYRGAGGKGEHVADSLLPLRVTLAGCDSCGKDIASAISICCYPRCYPGSVL